ncbi:MAG: hydantoinase/oxoprolinase family protein [Nitrospinota bacterium]|nr:hydantoinase/oxoprolinase family protein [Nitrospinota bacterium]
MASYRIGIDVGGTFTDLVLLNEESGEVHHTKVLTSYPNPAEGVLRTLDRALEETGVASENVNIILHGTTIATNSLLQRRGARTALITTEGFRDVLEIGRQIRPSLFDWRAEKPPSLAPRRRRFELHERVIADGSVMVEPSDEDFEKVVEKTLASKPEAVAVSLLFSFLNPAYEERLLEELLKRQPDLSVSLSSRVLPEYREFERTSTTVANAFTTPVLTNYSAKLEGALGERGLAAQLRLLQSNGGIGTVDALSERCISTALSGPAGGVTAAAYLSVRHGLGDCISFDMGGTSSDICLIRDGKPEWTVDAMIGGFPVRIPMIDVHTVGAGGGSVIWVDSGGGLRVGPRSAGSNPGPACYGFGGEEPTTTDAHMEVGSLQTDFFEGKDIPFRPEAGTEALRKVGSEVGMEPAETAAAALQVVNHSLAKEIRAVCLTRGFDASDFTLIPFGGAGQLHACAVAEELTVAQVHLPNAAGVLSALGASLADYRYDFSRALIRRSADVKQDDISSGFGQLETLGQERLADFPARDVRIERSVDLRYVGQSFEINVNATRNGDLLPVAEIIDDFHRMHEFTYGFCDVDEPVEFVNLRISVFGLTSKPEGILKSTASDGEEVREVSVLSSNGEKSAYRLINRAGLSAGDKVEGSSIIYDAFATALVPAGWTGVTDESGHILLKIAN